MSSRHRLTVFKPPFPKKRVGKDNDGGYIICDLEGGYDAFISGGIDDDISFEEHFLKENPGLKCIAFDGTTQMVSPLESLEIVKKNIGILDTATTVNLRKYVTPYSNIFMKMDIEGGEYSLFYTLTDEDLLNIKQLVIEFHSENEATIPERLCRTHWLVHLHVNNCLANELDRGIRTVDGVWSPVIYECTYIRKNPGENLKLNTSPIPDPLIDQPNCIPYPEVNITWPPFVN
jgi:hypothetical protein